MRLPDDPRLRAVWRLLRIPLLLTVLYLALRPVLAALSARHGYGSPDGVGAGYLAVAAAVMVLRLALLVVVPAVLAYRLVVRGVTYLLRQQD
ncbi:hypothetical protein [Nocardia concava]|uniref:hypothetical protein n=1 Tax=Nocardia concava TaxID=257281 RepID=UPI00031452BA|nr:hypothetical protein [Nocardia concava]